MTEHLLASHDVVIVTARLDEEVELAREWLRRRGLGGIEVVHTGWETKRSARERLRTEVHLDDAPLVLMDHPEAMVPALLHTPYNATLERCALARPMEDWLAFERLVGVLASEGVASG